MLIDRFRVDCSDTIITVPTGELLASASYGTHLKNWQWRGMQSAAAWEPINQAEKAELAYAQVQGTNGPLRVKSKCWEQVREVLSMPVMHAKQGHLLIANLSLRRMEGLWLN